MNARRTTIAVIAVILLGVGVVLYVFAGGAPLRVVAAVVLALGIVAGLYAILTGSKRRQ